MSARGSRFYGMLLRVLPREFRARHGVAMAETFAALHDDAREAGLHQLALLWIRECRDLVRTGVALRTGGVALRTAGVPGRRRHTSAPHGGPMPVHARQRGRLIGNAFDDLRLAARATTRSRSFFMLAAVTLALGIGATTAMYSALRAVVLDPLPFPTSERLVMLWRTTGGSGAFVALEKEQTEALRAERSIFDGIEGILGGTSTLTGATEPVRVRTLSVSAGVPALMEVRPVIGRVFTPAELAGDGERVLLLSHAFWRSRFGSRTDVIGETVSLDGEGWTILGVMPREAVRPDGDPLPVDMWLPLGDAAFFSLPLARLAAGTSVDEATARVDAIVRRSVDDGFATGGIAIPVVKAGPMHEHLRVLMIAVVLLLLIACVNVSNLLLQRASVRGRETAIRAVLGAGRLRLMRQHLFESGILALAGGALGAALAYGGVRATLLALSEEQLAALHTVRIDERVLLFCVAVSAAAGVLFGLLPAVRGTRVDATAALGRSVRADGGGSAGVRWTLVTAQVALSFALLVGAALVTASLREMSSRDPGYRADGLISVDVRLPAWRHATPAARQAAFESIVTDVRRTPGVTAVSLADGVPPRVGSGWLGHVHVEGNAREPEPSFMLSGVVDTAYFATLGQPIIAGRGFTAEDVGANRKAAVITQSAARRLFPGEDAIGRRFGIEGPPEYTVVGVARDIRATGLTDDGSRPLIYSPIARVAARMTVIARADRTDHRIMLDLRQVVHRAEPDAITEIATVRELLGETIGRERFTTSLLSTFAALALLLAAVGLYGLLSQIVNGRTHEFGVRMALGADRVGIRRLVLRAGLLATFAGLAIGAFLAGAGLRMLRSEVAGLADAQPVAYVAAAALLVGVALSAMVIPAARAARLDPMQALRAD